ncbi:MAG: hypothetical protein KC502_07675 [Myxococcales bacterium]|nr:hypothetical protein [Myxococcales bacterium]
MRLAISVWRTGFCAALLLTGLLVSCVDDPVADRGKSGDVSAADASVVDVTAGDVSAVDVTASDDAQKSECVVATDCAGELAACRAWKCVDGACKESGQPDGLVCGDACAPGVCKLGTCNSSPKTCADDGNPCTTETCVPESGKCVSKKMADDKACSDGDACTEGDVCKDGTCTAGEATCQCETSKDCEKHEDGNACTGTLFCEKSSGKCIVNPATVISCSNSKDTACRKNTCAPATGKCAMTALKDGTPCDDGDKCVVGDTCKAGACEAGFKNKCPDDGDVCNGTPFCNKVTGACAVNPATVITCKSVDDTACEANLCDKKTGTCSMVTIGDGKPCDDGNPCTIDETCGKGKCASKTNTCSCATDSDCAAKDDGNLCNGTLFCNQALKKCQLNPATVVTCQTVDNTACKTMTCQPKTGKCALLSAKDGATCDDGNACTVGDACETGVCKPATTAPQCKCTQDADCGKFEDGDLCNGTLVCDKTTNQCIVNPKTKVVCKTVDDGPCSHNVCVPKTGKCALTPANVNSACDDAQPCTVADRCGANGKCLPGNDICQCGPHKPGYSCEDKLGDGKVCNGVLWCDKKTMPFKCAPNPNTVVQCKTVDDTACQKSVCNDKTGKCGLSPVAAMIGKSCDDGNPCFIETKCQNGLCQGGAAKSCDDDNACTKDACGKATDCTHVAVDSGPCSDGDACTKDATCSAKKCVGGVAIVCDDKNPCTGDACDKTKGCVTTPLTINCSDNNACTVGDVCKSGTCAPGTVNTCDDSNPCTKDSCDKVKGCAHTPTDAPCSDGKPCTDGDACSKGKCVPGKPKSCDDGNSCTTDACDPKTGDCTKTTTDGADCNLGDGTGECIGSKCEPVVNCAVFDKVAAYAGAQESLVHQVIPMTGGGHAAVGQDRVIGGKWSPRIMGLDSNGKTLWTYRESSKQYADCSAEAVFDATDGGPLDDGKAAVVAVGGNAQGSSIEGAIWRVGSDGKLVDRTLFGGSKQDRFLFATRYEKGLVAVGETSTDSNGKTDCWVVRTAGAKPVTVWNKRFGGNDVDVCFGVAAVAKTIVAAGSTDSDGDKTDAFVLKLSATGQLLWKKNYGGPGNQRLRGVGISPKGEIWGVGTTTSNYALKPYVLGLSAAGAQLYSRIPGAQFTELTDLVMHSNGTMSVLGKSKPIVSGSPNGKYLQAAGLARLNTIGKVTWHKTVEKRSPMSYSVRLTAQGNRYFFGASDHHDIDGDKKPELRGRVMVSDAWGHLTCSSAEQCLTPGYRYCDDGEACTTDSCKPSEGCQHAPVSGCTPAKDALDLDHDGLVGKADSCPTVWNPDGAVSACGGLAGSPSKKLALRMATRGGAAGCSDVRRSNEPVEVPLVNGMADPTLVGHWRFDGNNADSSGNNRTLKDAEGGSVPSILGAGSAMDASHDKTNSSSTLAPFKLRDATIMLWANVQPNGEVSCDLVNASGAVVSPTVHGHMKMRVDDDGAIRISYGPHNGDFKGLKTEMVRIRSEDDLVDTRTGWQHYALVIRANQAIGVYLNGDGVLTKSDDGHTTVPASVVGLKYLRLGEDNFPKCSVHIDDALIVGRALSAREIKLYVDSRRPYGTTLTPGVQPDLRDVQVTERATWDSIGHRTHSEVVGRRPMGAADLKDAVAYWRLSGDGKDEVSGKKTAAFIGTKTVAGGLHSADKAAAFDGSTSYAKVTAPEVVLGDFTAEAWFRIESAKHARAYLLDTRNSKSAGKKGLALILDRLQGEHAFRLRHLVSDGTQDYAASFSVHLDGGWHHTALRRESGQLHVFVDGVRVPAIWANGKDKVTTALPIFGSRITRIGYYGGGTLGSNFKDYAFHGAIDEIAIHKAALSDNELARRTIGLPRVRFLAQTQPNPALEGYLYHRYSLHWGDAQAKAQLPKVVALDKKTVCHALLSPCLGYAGWWRFQDAEAQYLAVDETSMRTVGKVQSGQLAGSAMQSKGYGTVDLGAWKLPFVGGDYALEWRGAIANFAGNVGLVGRKNGSPAIRIDGKKWAHQVSGGASVKGPTVTTKQPYSLAATYKASSKQTSLYFQGKSAGSASGYGVTGTAAQSLLIGSTVSGEGLIGRTSDVRIMSRALTADELLHSPRTGWRIQ